GMKERDIERQKEQAAQRQKDRENQEKLTPARAGTDYHGRIVAIQGDLVIQRDSRTQALIAHNKNMLTGGKLTLDQDTMIRYPRDSAIGLIKDMEKQTERSMQHGMSKKVPERELDL